MLFDETELQKIREVQKELNYGNLLAKKVVSYVCLISNIDVENVMSKSIKREYVTARHICWHILMKKYDYTHDDISKIFGVKHRAIQNGIDEISPDLKVFCDTHTTYDIVIKLLNENAKIK